MPIPKEQLEAARRKLKRRVASMLIRGMAEQDMSFEQMAEKLGEKPAGIRQYIHDLIDGVGEALNPVSDICLALDCEPEFSIQRRAKPQPAPIPETPSE